ncbi:MAG: alkaline phosphatase family protein [Planctomycetota bacterium]
MKLSANQGEGGEPAQPTGPGDRLARRVLLIGWDAADWAFARPLMDAGLMPTLSRFVEHGHHGQIATLQPMLSPMLWTSIATGYTADRHGIHGFTEPAPDDAGVRPVASTSRTCKALWNILSQHGLRSNVVGWYATQPAEPILGSIVGDRFEQPASPLPPHRLPDHPEDQPTAPWPVAHGSVYPAERGEELGELRVHPTEIDASAVLPFVPEAQRIVESGTDAQRAKLRELRALLAQTASMHTITTRLMEADDWDLTAVYYEGIDRFAHAFMAYHPPKLDGVDAEEFELFRGVMTGIYRFHDMMLETLLKLAGPETAVILLSDHGYHHDEHRPGPDGKHDPVGWHRPFGLVALGGAGFAETEEPQRLYGASLLDVAPTVLRLLGLPVGSDMSGRPWLEAFERPIQPDRILSWENVDGPHADGRHPADVVPDPEAERAALQQLIDLGYVEAPGEDARKNVEDTRAANALNLATALMSLGKHSDALELLDALPERFADDPGIRLRAALAAMGARDHERAKQEAQRIAEQAERQGSTPPPRLHVLRGTLALAQRQLEDAEAHFAQLGDLDSLARSGDLGPGVLTRLGGIYLETQRFDRARKAFEKALAVDPESVHALDGLARIALHNDEPAGALDHALHAVGLIHHFPRGHLRVGQSLASLAEHSEANPGQTTHGLGTPDELRRRAAQAVELCLTQSSRYEEAHRTLAELYRKLGRNTEAVEQDALRVAATTSTA